jgi:hypothetical protein
MDWMAIISAIFTLAPQLMKLIQEIVAMFQAGQPVPPAKMAEFQAAMKAHEGLMSLLALAPAAEMAKHASAHKP